MGTCSRSALLVLQPLAKGAFLRGTGLNLATGRFTAPVSGIYQFSANVHIGECCPLERCWKEACCSLGLWWVLPDVNVWWQPFAASSVWYHTLNCLGFPKEPQYNCVFWTKHQRVIVAVLWMLMLISLLYTDHSELKSKVQLRARDNVRVLICIESLCHRYTWVTAILNHKYA